MKLQDIFEDTQQLHEELNYGIRNDEELEHFRLVLLGTDQEIQAWADKWIQDPQTRSMYNDASSLVWEIMDDRKDFAAGKIGVKGSSQYSDRIQQIIQQAREAGRLPK
jgi:hypothetical protein